MKELFLKLEIHNSCSVHKWAGITLLTTVLCSVTRPLNQSKVGVDLVLIQISLLFLIETH